MSTPIDSTILVGKSYTWDKTSIQFHRGTKLATPWVMGTYIFLDSHKVKAVWAGFTHILTFNENYTQFTSVRESDYNTLIGHLLKPEQLSTISSVRIDYKNASTELCHLGKRYNVDKSSQRENPGPDDSHHCHPYSLLYHALFKSEERSPSLFVRLESQRDTPYLCGKSTFRKRLFMGLNI